MSGARLSKPQAAMLAEIRATERGVLYVRRYTPQERTVAALERRGLVRCVERDHSSFGMDGWSLAGSDEGSAQ